MALESFGTETAKQVDRAVNLCHDLLKEHRYERVNEIFKASDPPSWWGEAGWQETEDRGFPVIVIKLGVG